MSRYFVFHANVKKGTTTTTAPTIQTHMPQPPGSDSPELLTLASRSRPRHYSMDDLRAKGLRSRRAPPPVGFEIPVDADELVIY